MNAANDDGCWQIKVLAASHVERWRSEAFQRSPWRAEMSTVSGGGGAGGGWGRGTDVPR